MKAVSKRVSKKARKKVGHESSSESWEVERVVGVRRKKGVKQYKVKWSQYDNRSNSWVDADEVNSPGLVLEFHNSQTGRSTTDIVQTLMALVITSGAANTAYTVNSSSKKPVLPELDVARAVEGLMKKQNLSGSEVEFGKGYQTEVEHMLDKRLELITDPKEASRIMVSESVVSLRMQLEAKKDGRKKARLLLQGFKEPPEWDLESNVSPVAFPSSIKTLVYKAGPAEDVIAMIDVSVAFLQSDRYGPNERSRYVSYRPYAGGPVYVFKLLGPIYGQRSAPRAWYGTLTRWLVADMGYVQGVNEPCLFTHSNGHVIVIHVDDLLTRGSQKISEEFFREMRVRFQCKEPEYLTPGSYLTFTGMDIGLEYEKSELIYTISQERELLEFLKGKGLDTETLRSSPMPRREVILTEGVIEPNTVSWVRSCIGGLHYFSRMTRWDIAHSVSRIGQASNDPKKGSVDQLKQLAGFLNNTAGYKIRGKRVQGKDMVTTMTDSNHHGDPKFTALSQSGVIILLNGVPVHWRSNRQPRSTLSPTESEIYALSTGVKDTRLYHWVLEEFNRVETVYPILVMTDSTGARSFQRDTCPSTRLRGCFDFREMWVEELRDVGAIRTELVSDSDNLADLFTKCHSNLEFVVRREKIAKAYQTQ